MGAVQVIALLLFLASSAWGLDSRDCVKFEEVILVGSVTPDSVAWTYLNDKGIWVSCIKYPGFEPKCVGMRPIPNCQVQGPPKPPWMP